MAVILSVETSTKVGSVSLHVDEQLVLYHESFVEKSHSEHLVRSIGNILAEAGFVPRDVDAIAVSKGPGSYTGLRIGVSVAKGFCYAHDIKLISVDTLLAMVYEAHSSGVFKGLYCPMIDARRMEVYSRLYDQDLIEINEIEAVIVEKDTFRDILDGTNVFFFGNGSDKCREILRHDNAVFLNGIYPKAKYIGEIARLKYVNNEFENLAYFEPYYLKEFIAKKPSGKNLV